MTVPVLAKLRRIYPQAKIFLVVRGRAQAALLQGSPLVDEILNLPSNKNKLALLQFFLMLRGLHLDAAYVATRIGPMVPALLRFLSGVKTIVGDGERATWLYSYRNRIDPKTHRVDRMLSTLSLWTGQEPGQPEFDLPIGAESGARAKAWLDAEGLENGRYIAIHPGGGKGTDRIKRLPVALIKQTIERLRREDDTIRLALLFGPDDLDVVPHFTPAAQGTSILSGAPLDETKYILSHAGGFLGCDSALGHLAASFGVPTVCASGPGNPDETRPYGPKAQIIQSPEELACRPCRYTKLWGHCPYQARCMTGIGVDAVLAAMYDWPGVLKCPPLHTDTKGIGFVPVNTIAQN